MVKGTFTLFNLLKVMPAAKNTAVYCPPPTTLFLASAVCILGTKTVIKLQIGLALLLRVCPPENFLH